MDEIDITEDSPEAADLREARSRRYTDAIRIMLLVSGRWALSDMATGELRIVEAISDEMLRAAAEVQRAAYGDYAAREAERRKQSAHREPAASTPPKAKLVLSLEDLFGAKA